MVINKIYNTIEKDQILFRVFNEKTHLFDQFTFNEKQFEELMENEIPQNYLLKSIQPFVENLFVFIDDILKTQNPLIKMSTNKDCVLATIPLEQIEIERQLKLICHRNLDNLFYVYETFSYNVLDILSNLAIPDLGIMEIFFFQLFTKRLKTVCFSSSNIKRQTKLLNCINRLLKSLKKLHINEFNKFVQNIRIWLINIGTNPMRHAVYNFCIEVKDPLEFYIRFFKTSLCKLKSAFN